MDLYSLKTELDKAFDYFRINYEQSKSFVVNSKNKEVKRLTENSTEGFSIFVVKNNKAVRVSTNDFTKKTIKETLRKAKKIVKTGEKIEYLDLIDTKELKVNKQIGHSSHLDRKKIIKTIIKHSNNSQVNVNDLTYKELEVKKHLITPDKDIQQQLHYNLISNIITIQKEGKLREEKYRFGNQNSIDTELENLNTITEQNKKEAIRKLSYKSMLKGTYDVIIDPKLAHLLAHEAIGHACESDIVSKKESCLKLGKKISNTPFNIIDDPTIKNHYGSYIYDEEGTKATKRMLVKKGIINEFLTDLKQAKELHIKPNGAARSERYSNSPIPRMSNTGFDKGFISKEEMFEDFNGLILEGGTGGQVDPASGTFQFGVKEAFLKSKNTNYVNISFSGNILKDLFKITQISKEVEYSNKNIGWCGKDEQLVPVSGFGPYIKFKGVRF